MNRTARFFLLGTVSVMLAACANPNDGPPPLTSATYERALALLQLQFQSTDAAVRSNCIEALQVSSDPRAADVIEQGLLDKEWVVRFSAAMASADLKGKRASDIRPTLNTMVEHDPSGSVRAGCIYALRKFGDTAHMSDLAALLDAPDFATEANTALVLGLMGDNSAIPLLQLHHEKQDIRVRFELTSALARLGDEPSQQVIAGWALNKFAEDQWSAMTVCADLPLAVGRSPLLLGLEDVPVKLPLNTTESDKAVIKNLTTRRQLVAARSLAKVHDYSGVKVALQNIPNPDASLRSLAVLALGEMLTSRQAPKLDSLLSDPDDGVKRATAAAIVSIYARAQATGS